MLLNMIHVDKVVSANRLASGGCYSVTAMADGQANVRRGTDGRSSLGPAASRTQSPESWLARNNTSLTIAAACLTPALYLAFVIRFSMNMPFSDDWAVVPLIHAAIHGGLSFSALWAQYNQDRMFIPNLVFVANGIVTRDNLDVIIGLTAAIFIASFALFLILTRSYLGGPLKPLSVLVLGVLWFSLEDWHNTLWAFQLGWYITTFCLVAMLVLLVIPQWRSVAFILATLAAIAASFSSLQGLALWPVGLLCMLWTEPKGPRQWNRGKGIEILVWLAAAAGTAGLYFLNYAVGPATCKKAVFIYSCASRSSTYSLHHPIQAAEFFFVEIGEVIPNSVARTLWLNGLLGAMLFIAAAIVVVQSVRRSHGITQTFLPVGLITFGLLFDIFIAAGRAGYGLSLLAPQSSYSMPNLLILVGITTFVLKELRLKLRRPLNLRARTLVASGMLLVVVQLGATTHAGITNARTWDRHLTTGGQLVVNLNRIPVGQRGCYSFYGVLVYLYPVPGVFRYRGFTEAQEDKLSVFATGAVRKYRASGLPYIPQCQGQ